MKDPLKDGYGPPGGRYGGGHGGDRGGYGGPPHRGGGGFDEGMWYSLWSH